MLKKIDPTKTKSWQKLADHFITMEHVQMRDLFADDPRRFEKFSIRFNDILLDYSKNIMTDETCNYLLSLAEECDLKDGIKKMFSGKVINETEGRAVLHIALRNRDNHPISVNGRNVMADVNRVLNKMKNACKTC